MREAGPSRRELLPQRLLAQLNEMALPELAFEAEEAEGDEQEPGPTVNDHHCSQLNHPAHRIALRRVRAFLHSARTFGHASALHRSVSMRRRRSEMRSHGCCQSCQGGVSTARNLCWGTRSRQAAKRSQQVRAMY